MSVDIWKVFQTIPLTHPTNFALVNIALNQLPGGPDGPDPPDGAGASTGVRDDQAEVGSPL